MVSPLRCRELNGAPIDPQGAFVLYWMTAFRRARFNFSLQHAVEQAESLGKPLIVLEALRVAYPWACDRLHQFILEGMACNRHRFEGRAVTYYPYVERSPGEGSGLLETLAGNACLVVTDDYPSFFLRRMIEAVAPRLGVKLEAVDSNGLLPLRDTERLFLRAVDFRRYLQRSLAPYLAEMPDPDPLAGVDLPRLSRLPPEVTERWPRAPARELARAYGTASKLPIDHEVGSALLRGGSDAAEAQCSRFLEAGLDRYLQERNQPDADGASGLSPYLHFGHLSVHEVLARIAETEAWTPFRAGEAGRGQRTGWWGMSEPAESFLDQIVTWRELGFNMTSRTTNYDQYESLPEWARRTLDDHRCDPREYVYDLETFEAADTHDVIWNAAQRQLVSEGRMHNYLRMLWGKKILEWSLDPERAIEVMIELNNKYALDGRDPNSYSGIFWCLGRYDRAWGPEREVYGKIRYMSSDNTRRKLKLRAYLERYAGD